MRVLLVEAEGGRENPAVFKREINLNAVRVRQGCTQFLGVPGHLTIVNGQPRVQDYIVESVERRSAKAELLAFRGKRGGCRPSGDAQDQIVFRIDVPV